MIQLRVCIDVEDLDRALAFYTQALGLTPGRRKGSLADPFGHGFCLLEFHGRGYDALADP